MDGKITFENFVLVDNAALSGAGHGDKEIAII